MRRRASQTPRPARPLIPTRARAPVLALAALALTALTPVTTPLAAQDFDVGAQLSFGNDSQLGLGPRVLTPLTSIHPKLRAVYSFDYFFPDSGRDPARDLDYWEIAGSVVRDIPVRKLKSYLGVGAVIGRSSESENIARTRSRTTLGLNLVGGLKFPEHEYTPFVEARAGGRQFVLAGGVLIPR